LNTPPLLQKQKIEDGWAEERAVGVSRPNNRVAQVGDGGGREGVEWQAFLVWLSVVELEPVVVGWNDVHLKSVSFSRSFGATVQSPGRLR